MSQAPRRNLPEKTNRTIATLLCVFFISIYFWNLISIRSFNIFYTLDILDSVSNRIQTFSFLELLSHRFENRFQYDIPKWIYVLNIFKFIESFFIPVFLFLFSTIFSYTLWALIHECVHGNFSNSKTKTVFGEDSFVFFLGLHFKLLKRLIWFIINLIVPKESESNI